MGRDRAPMEEANLSRRGLKGSLSAMCLGARAREDNKNKRRVNLLTIGDTSIEMIGNPMSERD